MSTNLENLDSKRNLWQKLASFLRLAGVYVVFNFKSQMEYRSAFASQVIAMFLNDCFWVAFWMYFYTRFPVLGSWSHNDFVTMWTVVAAGFGIAHGVAGNSISIATIIVKGQLDTWLLSPRAVLPHLLFGKMHVSAWGDFIFGTLAYLLLVHPSPQSFVLFLVLTFSTAILFVGFGVLVGSLGFFVGNAEGLSEQLRFALITFSTYPPSIFDGTAKLLLYTLIPAGFCGYVPVEAIRANSLPLTLLCFAASLLFLFLGTALFYFGLRRYESGNLIEMRG